MIKKIALCICLLIQTQLLIGQNTAYSYSGNIVEKDTRNSIFGVALMLEGRVICYSDEEGKFVFEVNNINKETNITFVHLSYKSKTVLLSELKELKTIELTQEVVQLEEVIISSKEPLTKKEILKNAVGQYENLKEAEAYWSNFNYKQTIYNNGNPQGFLECDGHIFMPENIAFSNGPIVVPSEMRRLNEDTEIAEIDFNDIHVNSKVKRQSPYKYIGSLYMKRHWTDYSVFVPIHPLSKKEFKHYKFDVEKIVHKEASAYYVIQFKQKKHTFKHNGGWEIAFMQGKLWVDASTFNLLKVVTQFRHGWHKSYIKYEIDYDVNQNKLYPSRINLSTYKYTKSGKHNIVKKGTVTLNNKYKADKKNPFIRGGAGSLVWYKVHETYNPEYWKSHPLKDIRYKNDVLSILDKQNWDVAFKKAASQKEYKENSIIANNLNYFEQNKKVFLNFMKKDLNLTE
ncbi:hypothetical protein ACJOV8_017380 [Formosa sp. 3Alg 14/1]|uniref:hypothetical protein n=1 Tax=Formosa sp. 3Alg 14/1 TaxID=3382190 RepID=UPI0039BE8398